MYGDISRGSCCCNCISYVPVMKHPWNKNEIAKGPISEIMGYGCLNNFEEPSPIKQVVFCDRGHGLCEMHTPKKHEEKDSI